MRKIIIIFFLSISFSVIGFSQVYKKFKVGLGVGYAPLNKDYAGFFATIEPAYHVSDDLTIGLRMQAGFLGGAPGGIDNVGGAASITMNGQYYLTQKKFRAFVGAGLGLFLVQGNYYGHTVGNFGFYPRIGFDVGHFSLAVDYNFIPSAPLKVDYIMRSFPEFRMGFFFGGGKVNPGPSGNNHFVFKFGLGSAINGGESSSGGILITIEPSFLVNEHLSIGFRIESAKQARKFYGATEDGSILSFTTNGQYYFNSNRFRPYVGTGLGLYLAGNSLSETKFGFYPRVGFDVGHFSLAFDYNLVETTKISSYVFNNSYLGIRILYVLGGKK